MSEKKVAYSSNNSGGSWWLTDEDWRSLEREGWTVEWVAEDSATATYLDKDGRWLGALAKRASKSFPAPYIANAVKDWERITGQNASDLGCTCCGPPHSFSVEDVRWDDGGYASGPEIAFLLDESEHDQLERLKASL
jgi:hypothetical protein